MEGASRAKGRRGRAGASSARLCAVQAVYQMTQNKQPARSLVDEYLTHRTEMEIDGERLAEPDGALFKAIVLGVSERAKELEPVLESHLKREGAARRLEPLLQSILVCGAYELLAHSHTDTPVIINEYLNVSHAFFEKGEVALVNAVLEAVATALRAS